MIDNNTSEFFVCECHSLDHMFQLSYHKDVPTLYFTVHLATETFWRRLLTAIKYVFGYRCRYGDFDEIILSLEKAQELRDHLNKFIDQNGINKTQD